MLEQQPDVKDEEAPSTVRTRSHNENMNNSIEQNTTMIDNSRENNVSKDTAQELQQQLETKNLDDHRDEFKIMGKELQQQLDTKNIDGNDHRNESKIMVEELQQQLETKNLDGHDHGDESKIMNEELQQQLETKNLDGHDHGDESKIMVEKLQQQLKTKNVDGHDYGNESKIMGEELQQQLETKNLDGHDHGNESKSMKEELQQQVETKKLDTNESKIMEEKKKKAKDKKKVNEEYEKEWETGNESDDDSNFSRNLVITVIACIMCVVICYFCGVFGKEEAFGVKNKSENVDKSITPENIKRPDVYENDASANNLPVNVNKSVTKTFSAQNKDEKQNADNKSLSEFDYNNPGCKDNLNKDKETDPEISDHLIQLKIQKNCIDITHDQYECRNRNDCYWKSEVDGYFKKVKSGCHKKKILLRKILL